MASFEHQGPLNLYKNIGSMHESENENDHIMWKFWKKRRYVVSILLCLGFCNAYILRINLNIAIVAMNQNKTVKHTGGNITYEREFTWDSRQRGFLLSSFFYGYITTQLFGGLMASEIGGKRLFGIGIGATGLLSFFIPLATKKNLNYAIALRIMQGALEGLTPPCMYAILSRWAPSLEKTILVNISLAGCYIGTVIAMPLCAYLCQGFGWESAFYASGGLTFVWLVCFWIFVSETPDEDRFITAVELKFIKARSSERELSEKVYPWKNSVTSSAVIAYVIAHFTEAWGLYTMSTQLPTFMKDVLNFDIEKTGWMSAIPYLATLGFTLSGGYLADFLRSKHIFTTTQVRKILNCGGFLAQGLCFIIAAYVMEPTAITVCITFGVGLGGMAWSGFGSNPLFKAPQYSSIIFGIGNTFSTMSGIASPILTGYLVKNSTADEWRVVFIIAGGIYLAGAVQYAFMGSGEIHEWTKNRKPETLLLSNTMNANV